MRLTRLGAWIALTLTIATLSACGDDGDKAAVPSPTATVAFPTPTPSSIRATPTAPELSPTSTAVAATPTPTPIADFVQAPFEVRVAADAPEAVRWAAADVGTYLEKMGREVSQLDGEEGSCTPGRSIVLFTAALGGSGGEDQRYRIREQRCSGDAGAGTLVELSGGGLLGRQYAAYEFLHGIGVRFFHPEEEYVPEAPRWPAAPFSVDRVPSVRWRTATLHLVHPLELGDAFNLCRPEYIDEARHYIDWQIKNLASAGMRGACGGELSDYGYRRGFLVEAGLRYWGAQQGGSGVIDPDDPRSDEEQVAAAIDVIMSRQPRPQLFTVNHQVTEFTGMPDDLVVRLLTFTANYFAQNYPDVTLLDQVHGTHTDPTPIYGVNYNTLGQFAPDNLGLQFHPLMFYDLFDPAPVYGNEDFHYMYDLMEANYQKRAIWYFPESAWWLTFDIPVPLYLPITIEARDRDIQGIKHMLAGGLQGHRLFGTGHEWGYWQNEYCSYRMAANVDYRWTDCLDDITSALGPRAADVRQAIEDVVAVEQRDLFDRDMLRYYVGTDDETEAAEAIGIEFHPLPPKPVEILSWDESQVQDWQNRIAPALERSAADYAAIAARLDALEGEIDPAGASFFREIRDGVEANALRLRHQREVYGAVVTFRAARLAGDAEREGQAFDLLAAARQTTEAARAVVERREADYRYRPLARSIAGGADGTEDLNWTIYHYRYLDRAHQVFYYTRIDDLAEAALAGAGQSERLTVTDSLLAPGETLAVQVRGATLSGLSLDFGDGTVLPLDGPGNSEHDYAAPGFYRVVLQGEAGGEPFRDEATVVVLAAEYSSAPKAVVLEPPAVSVVEPLIPAVVFGPTADGKGAIGFDVDGSGHIGKGLWLEVELTDGAAVFQSAPIDAQVPIANKGVLLTSVTIFDATLRLDTAEATPHLTGDLGIESIVQAIVDVGGFEENGARSLVAMLLGLTPQTLPERVPIVIEWETGGA